VQRAKSDRLKINRRLFHFVRYLNCSRNVFYVVNKKADIFYYRRCSYRNINKQ